MARPSRTQLITQTYNGLAFTFREDGWFNMTHAAKSFGKRLDHFWDNAGTVDYMVALAETLQVNPLFPGITPEVGSTDFTLLKNSLAAPRKGYHTKPEVGTWAHPKLAVFFARWLDVRFAVWCDAMIDDILNKKAEVVITKPEESAVMALPEMVGNPDLYEATASL
jgi:hypothetical protein